MKVCTHKGLTIAVLTRNEHCPPHVHAGTAEWDARFLFSFWHNGVRLWDVAPARNEPNASTLEELRQVLKLPENLCRARGLWWVSRQTVCLDNLQWDMAEEEAVSSRERRLGACDILSARFEAQGCRTVLQLAGQPGFLEIEL
ncbi:DUF4160 domain-containing protein [Pigmentiphaga humi]|uniref:DUF4160 domain-containing protein n=1 Tax=Pigmentiphaga humi TaxID=2478468 RepID=UPI000F51E307|nr:DUF4160 domain-containing protein [Pigmentiphaga humi]